MIVDMGWPHFDVLLVVVGVLYLLWGLGHYVRLLHRDCRVGQVRRHLRIVSALTRIEIL